MLQRFHVSEKTIPASFRQFPDAGSNPTVVLLIILREFPGQTVAGVEVRPVIV